jgi:hypothetical protein
MSVVRGVALHGALFGVASVLALYVWTRDEKPKTSTDEQIEVWSGRMDDLTSVTYETDKLRVQLEPRKDSFGRWYTVTLEKTVDAPPPSATGPDGGAPPASLALPAGGDAGGADAGKQTKRETQRFVAAKEGEKLAEMLAPLMGLRALGKVDPARAEEFGFDKPQGTLRVAFGSRQHSLVIGGTTPGGGDRYAKDGTDHAFAISGDVSRNIEFAESRLIERELHGFKPEEIKRVKITKGQASRELVRVEEKQDGWADLATPDKLNETAGNWMAKVGRLRVQQYVETVSVPILPEYQIVRIEYFDAKKSIGHMDMVEIPENKGNAGYLVQTEFTRWHAQVLKSSAEQVEQDLPAVLGSGDQSKPAGGDTKPTSGDKPGAPH